MTHPSRPLRAVTLFPLAAIACGDDANGVALAHRAARRGLALHHEVVHEDQPVPSADVYLLGGRGTADLAALVARLGADAGFADGVADGAVVLAVDAGLDALGHGWRPANGPAVSGLGMLDVTTVPGPRREDAVVSVPRPDLGLPSLTGWVQTDVALAPGPGYEPFVSLELGVGDVGSCDGVTTGRILGTRLHGPLAAVNPEVADLLLAWATDQDPRSLPPLDDTLAQEARRRRIALDREEAVRRERGVVARLARATRGGARRART